MYADYQMTGKVTDGATIVLAQGSAVPYHAALAWQHDTADLVRSDDHFEALALIEHAPVYTMGRRGGRAALLVPVEMLRAPIVDTERGGDITWHGPGQLVGYPILNLRRRGLRAADYVRLLEAALIEALADLGVNADVAPGRPGVWVGSAKIAAIGVAIRGGVSMHGFALNVSPDLAWFEAITPCGLADATVTSLAAELPTPPSMDAVVEAVRRALERRLASTLAPVTAPFPEAAPA